MIFLHHRFNHYVTTPKIALCRENFKTSVGNFLRFCSILYCDNPTKFVLYQHQQYYAVLIFSRPAQMIPTMITLYLEYLYMLHKPFYVLGGCNSYNIITSFMDTRAYHTFFLCLVTDITILQPKPHFTTICNLDILHTNPLL